MPLETSLNNRNVCRGTRPWHAAGSLPTEARYFTLTFTHSPNLEPRRQESSPEHCRAYAVHRARRTHGHQQTETRLGAQALASEDPRHGREALDEARRPQRRIHGAEEDTQEIQERAARASLAQECLTLPTFRSRFVLMTNEPEGEGQLHTLGLLEQLHAEYKPSGAHRPARTPASISCCAN
jgi:hypothetical protein